MLPNNIAGARPSACGEADSLWRVSLQSLPPKTVMQSLFFPASAHQLCICAELQNSSSSYAASPHEPLSHVVPVLNKASVCVCVCRQMRDQGVLPEGLSSEGIWCPVGEPYDA